MIAEGVEIDVPHIISLIVTENYAAVLNGALAVEAEALRSYERCAEIAHTLADFIRSLGYRAIADHNCIEDIQAIPALYACGMGELGKHGSLIHPRFGSGFRASFVVTDAPLVLDSPRKFGVEETCMRCNVCTRNCPPAAIPSSDEFIVTEGVKRWLTNIERCYLASRMREEYCHICVDVCPYVRSSPPDPVKSTIYSTYMAKRRKAGWNTPAWFIEDEQRVMTDGTTSD
jgi:epoxyqueuosine reductase QueG